MFNASSEPSGLVRIKFNPREVHELREGPLTQAVLRGTHFVKERLRVGRGPQRHGRGPRHGRRRLVAVRLVEGVLAGPRGVQSTLVPRRGLVVRRPRERPDPPVVDHQLPAAQRVLELRVDLASDGRSQGGGRHGGRGCRREAAVHLPRLRMLLGGPPEVFCARFGRVADDTAPPAEHNG